MKIRLSIIITFILLLIFSVNSSVVQAAPVRSKVNLQSTNKAKADKEVTSPVKAKTDRVISDFALDIVKGDKALKKIPTKDRLAEKITTVEKVEAALVTPKLGLVEIKVVNIPEIVEAEQPREELEPEYKEPPAVENRAQDAASQFEGSETSQNAQSPESPGEQGGSVAITEEEPQEIDCKNTVHSSYLSTLYCLYSSYARESSNTSTEQSSQDAASQFEGSETSQNAQSPESPNDDNGGAAAGDPNSIDNPTNPPPANTENENDTESNNE